MLEVMEGIDTAQDRMDHIDLRAAACPALQETSSARTDAGGQAQGGIRSSVKTEASRLEEWECGLKWHIWNW